MKIAFASAGLALVSVACSLAPGEQRRMETAAELQAQDEKEYANSPNVQLPELRERLHRLGISDAKISEVELEEGFRTFVIAVDDKDFARLDKVALAKLLIDSHYRFHFKDSGQVTQFAHYAVAESDRRRKARYLRELAENGEIGKYPVYSAEIPMPVYARSLERYCGYAPGEALNVVEGRWLEYRHNMSNLAVADKGDTRRAMASFRCIVRIVYVTDLKPQFIGNRGQGANNI